EHLRVDVLHGPGPEIHRVTVARSGALAELEGHAATGSQVRRNHVDRPVLAVEFGLDREGAAARQLDDQDIHRALVDSRVLVLVSAGPDCRPELLPRAAGALRQREGLLRRVRAERDDVEDGSTGAASESRVTDQGTAAALFLARALDAALARVGT